jgi:NAD(P)-dependent dehydrogenase (short-subunit alcohol dehydrogenase family)
MRFESKSVIITGGGGKIAKAYATAFAKEGAKVSLPDVAGADGVVKAIKDMGGTAISMTCDVADEKSVKTMAMKLPSSSVPSTFSSITPLTS